MGRSGADLFVHCVCVCMRACMCVCVHAPVFMAVRRSGMVSISDTETMYSSSPHSSFEKSFSGLYLGELVRLVLVKLTQLDVLFSGQLPPSLVIPWSLTTSHVTQIEW